MTNVSMNGVVDLDLSEFDTIDTAEMVVKHPISGAPTTWVITFSGPGHAQTIELNNRRARESGHEDDLKEQARVNGRKWKAPELSVDERRERNLDWIVSRIVGWTPVKINGDDFPFTRANAMKIIGDQAKPKLFEQCNEFLVDERTFTKRSALT